MMKYKGYAGVVQFDDEAKIFHGEVLGLKDVITFQGKTVNELEQAFKDSILHGATNVGSSLKKLIRAIYACAWIRICTHNLPTKQHARV